MPAMDLWLGQIWVQWRLSVKIVRTTKKYPWELPLGYSDEFSMRAKSGSPRGTTKTLAEYLKKGAIPKDIGDGFCLVRETNQA